MPTSQSKRRNTLRRKRNEYHRYITKYYFEFDFGLTDRKLSGQNNESNNNTTSEKNAFQEETTSQTQRPSLKQAFQNRLSQSRGLARSQSTSPKTIQDETKDISLLPLFSQPSKGSDTDITISSREDYLLQQIRNDIYNMVDIPIGSSTKSVQKSPSRYNWRNKPLPVNIKDMNGSQKTTRNRLFSNALVKASLERILYLWSIRMEEEEEDAKPATNTEYTTRYNSNMVDFVYPLYWINIQGYIWDSHISTFTQDVEPKRSTPNLSQQTLGDVRQHSLKFRYENDDIDYEYISSLKHSFELDDVEMEQEPNTHLEEEERLMKLQKMHELALGIGIETIPEEILEEIEADTYWLLENFMTAIHDYRTNHAFQGMDLMDPNAVRPKKKISGLQNMVILIEKVTQRVDLDLYKFLKSYGVEYIWFTYRWLNSIHVRDMNEKCILRLWDTCMCEEVDKESGAYFSTFGFNAKRARKRLHLPGFLNFQVYICVALLHRLKDEIMKHKSFEDILHFLRNPGIDTWDTSEIELILSQAYVWSTSFQGSENQVLNTAKETHNDDTLKKWTEKCHWPPRSYASTTTKPTMLGSMFGNRLSKSSHSH